MKQVETVREYLRCLAQHDGDGAAAVFTPTGVMDDGDGHHRAGRAAVKALIDSVPADITVDAPRHLIEEGNRVVAYGILGGARFGKDIVKLRWVFHFENGLIAHLTNSFVTVWDGPE